MGENLNTEREQCALCRKFGTPQCKWEPENTKQGDVLRHTLLVLQGAKPGVESQLSALLHDVGKPQTQKMMNGLINFIGHEKVSGEIAEGILRRLKFDSGVISRVRKIVENHMRPLALTNDDAGPTGLRRFIREVGDELVDAVLDLAEADMLGTLPPNNMIPDLRDKLEKIMLPVQQAEKLPIDGKDIQRILGVSPGRVIGEALKYLKDKKFEFAQQGIDMTKEQAEEIVRSKFAKGT